MESSQTQQEVGIEENTEFAKKECKKNYKYLFVKKMNMFMILNGLRKCKKKQN